jgi:AcrR family transcriptional regulator
VPLQGRSEQASREQRILDAAGELLLRFGYRRVTVEDVAARSGVGKGTVYLHWKAKQELFASLLLREVGDVMLKLAEGMRADPAEVLLHRMMRASFLAIMRRPLARALYTRDIDTLGKLAGSDLLQDRQRASDDLFAEYVDLLREHRLLRTDTDRATQVYALQAAGAGFYFMEQFLPPDPQLPLEHKAAALAEIIRRAFEPPEDPDLDTLCAIAPRAVELFNLMRTGGPPEKSDATDSVRESP